MLNISRRHSGFIFGKKNQLRYKVMKDSFKYFIFSYVVLFFFLFLINLQSHSFSDSLFLLRDAFFAALLSFIIMGISLKYTLQKHLLSVFELNRKEMREIKKGNFSKRLSYTEMDELGELNYFINGVLDSFEKKLNFEKNYSLTDPLTLCYNRRALTLAFSKFSSRISRSEKVSFSMLLFDLDFFKKINDTFGHTVGDKVLQELSKVIKKHLRNEDTIYRIGGEEFVVLFFNLPKTKEKKLYTRLQQSIAYELSKKLPQIPQKITISGGVVHSKNFNLKENNVLKEMLDKADKLLYKAKHSGRNKILIE
jgi:diguanylate cyclase (GGDEF)-like protein